MKLKRSILVLVIAVTLSILLVGTVFGEDQETKMIDPNIPEAWNESPKLASELDITKFNQSPMLDKLVEEGKLPPVEERLPNDPPVIAPYEDIGSYGGTAVVWSVEFFGWMSDVYKLSQRRGNLVTPDGKKSVPFHLKGWEYSDDMKKFTIFLHEGRKWSDGTPISADDYMFRWKHVYNNEELNPVPPEKWSPPLLDMTKEDEYTVTYHYGKPVPHEHKRIDYWGHPPAHFMKQFHPDFVGEEEANKLAKEQELEEWYELYQYMQDDSYKHPEKELNRPVLFPYIATERTETYVELKRNPYYPFVDPEGNQLPYIDKIRIRLANSPEMVAMKATTGEATLSARRTNPTDIPLYKKNEEKGEYRTLLYSAIGGGTISAIHFNYSHEDEDLRNIFQNKTFRRALSLAIDRETINNKVFYGSGVSSQNTTLPINDIYEEKFAKAYAEYDPRRAQELLDEIGVVDKDGDGFRELPNGNELNPTLIYCETQIDPTPIMEMVKSTWNDIGIDLDIKYLSRSLLQTRLAGNEFDMTQWRAAQSVMPSGVGFATWREYAPVAAQQVGWRQWASWFETGGESGEEPPEEMKKLNQLAETAIYSTDTNKRKEAERKLLEKQAENVWSIGTVSLVPKPILASNELKNIPEVGFWDWCARYLNPYHPEQFYLEGSESEATEDNVYWE